MSEEGEVTSEPSELMGSSGSSPVRSPGSPSPGGLPFSPGLLSGPTSLPCSRSPRPGSWHSEHPGQASEQVTPVPCSPLHTKCFHLKAGSG